jgi:hypothetical protein
MNSNPTVHSSIIHHSVRYVKNRKFKEYGRRTFPFHCYRELQKQG